MTYRAHITHGIYGDDIAIYLVYNRGDDAFLVKPVELLTERIDRDTTTTTQAPSLRMDDDMARALLDALAAHYGGTSDVQTLRKDYLAERARVDKLIDRLVTR